eukprot:1321218-Pyramimonas_sp.AAC.1
MGPWPPADHRLADCYDGLLVREHVGLLVGREVGVLPGHVSVVEPRCVPRQPREERGVGLEVGVQLLVDLQPQRPHLLPHRLDGSFGS